MNRLHATVVAGGGTEEPRPLSTRRKPKKKKMEANELMIGNYLRVNRDGLCIKKGTIVEVRGIDADDKLIEKGLIGSTHCRPLDDNQFEGGIWCEYLDPIPVTPEILERNGFNTVRGSESTYMWGFHNGRRDFATVCITFYNEPIGGVSRLLKIETNSKKEDGINAAHSCDVDYVHQLQQALRLCGIKKDIKF